MQESEKKTEWTKEENKRFERALALYDEETPDRWQKVAAMIPGKTVTDVMQQYIELEADVSDIEAGLVPIPGYLTPSFNFDIVNNNEFNAFRKRPLATGSSDHERKKGVPWTEAEHRRFLMGLEKYGKGDWRNISRNFVISKTPTQVASHAQKYFLRRSNINRRRRRSSLFDITTESVSAIPMEEKVCQNRKFPPLVSPTQLTLAETFNTNGSQNFPVTMYPVSMPIQIDNPMEKFTFGQSGQTTRTRMVDLNLNQGLPEDLSPLSLNLSLSLDHVQGQFSRRSAFETLSSFNNGDSIISVA